MSKRLPPLNSLKAFESAARHLSFTKAAEELFVTQAAVSHQIKLLEQFLGIVLFKRKNRALELTELGRHYYADIKHILRKLAEVTDKLLSQNEAKHLTISVPQTFGIHWLVPRLSDFNQQYPEIEIRLTGVDQDEGLLSQDIDVAVYYGRGNWNNVHMECLTGVEENRLQILASPQLLVKKPIYCAEDLKQHTLLHIHTRDNWQNMATALHIEDINIQHGPVFSHTFMALQAAIHGQGVVLANEILAKQEIEQGKLRVALNSEIRDPKAFYLVNHLNNMNDPKIIAFRRWITQAMRN
ncbi:LysR family glycine cleavage system transcriptional activator [Volucribacter psittacicida]|uniref:LysR family glycine cleavage system transcriptional activator n=1 Tax=Volucribacter psittacicida TaxID=203482 RepID=A0A4R1G2H6_9PAST|nr:transcriptional regulator GcvA [Volucribacter psittacicida]TCK01934.1 LysR family glycine cleavage system transcriptional activator [Volucribacter psittacicida]